MYSSEGNIEKIEVALSFHEGRGKEFEAVSHLNPRSRREKGQCWRDGLEAFIAGYSLVQWAYKRASSVGEMIFANG